MSACRRCLPSRPRNLALAIATATSNDGGPIWIEGQRSGRGDKDDCGHEFEFEYEYEYKFEYEYEYERGGVILRA